MNYLFTWKKNKSRPSRRRSQQGILDMNHSITWIGALINPIAISTSTVTHKQQGHMHDNNNLRNKNKTFQIDDSKFFEYKVKSVRTNPTIQITTPTMERRRERKAKGRPKRKPRGRQSPSHMVAPASLLLQTLYSRVVTCVSRLFWIF